MSAKEVLVTGGVLRPEGFSLGEGRYYGKACLVKLDLIENTVENLVEMAEGNEHYPEEYPNLQFTAGCLEGDRLWLPTDTEIRLYDRSSFKLLKVFSHPCFHNIHSVALNDDKLYVTSTGLDMVVILNKENGEIIEYINAEGKPVWHRFSRDVDYRKMHSTRPHDCHPNFVYWMDGEPWITRCTQEDTVSMYSPEKIIDLSGPDKEISVHDGIVRDNDVYFTSVDGCLIVLDMRTKKVKETIEVFKYDGYGGLRGWCRGLYLDGDIFYMGFSRLRKTKSITKLKWMHRFTGKGAVYENCNILGFDIVKRKIVYDYLFPDGVIDAIYTILPAK